MNDQQGRISRASYNRMSKIYGFLSGISEKKLTRLAIQQELEPEPGELILEAGFGTGQVLSALAEAVGEDLRRVEVSGLAPAAAEVVSRLAGCGDPSVRRMLAAAGA